MSGAQVRAVVFDLDGLLVDSEPVQIAAWEAFLAELGHTLDDALLAEMFGLRLMDSARLVRDRLGLPLTVEEVMARRDAHFFAALPGRLHPMPGARELVAALQARGVPLALATSGHRRYVDLALESAAIPKVFDVEVTGEMVQRGKPDPETFLTAARLLDVAPERCLVLEDSPNGVRAAKNAGMTCIAIPNDDTSGLDLSLADEVMGGLEEVLVWLDGRVT